MKTQKSAKILSFKNQQKLILLIKEVHSKDGEGEMLVQKNYKVLDLDGKCLLSNFTYTARKNTITGKLLEGDFLKIYCYQNFFVKTASSLDNTKTKTKTAHLYHAFTYKGNLITSGTQKWTEDKKIVDLINNIADEVDEEAYDRAHQDY
ncbi:MAG: hypothetical protein J6A28_04605 [Clostridia bacterium]|nr:hypothetical protein [Clostridia bacterium]